MRYLPTYLILIWTVLHQGPARALSPQPAECSALPAGCERLLCLGEQGHYLELLSLALNHNFEPCTEADALMYLALAFSANEQYDEATAQLDALFTQHPDDARYAAAYARVLKLRDSPRLPVSLNLPKGLNAPGHNLPGWVEQEQLVMLNELQGEAEWFPYRKKGPVAMHPDPAYASLGPEQAQVFKQLQRQSYSQVGPGVLLTDASLLCYTASHKQAYSPSHKAHELQLYTLELTERKASPQAWPLHSKGFHSAFPAWHAGRNLFIFSSNRPGGQGGMDLWYAEYRDGAWGEAAPFSEKVNSPADEIYADVLGDTLFFASNRDDMGYGGFDIYGYCLSNDSLWNLHRPINSAYDDFRLVHTAPGQAYMASSRPTRQGGDQVWKLEWVSGKEFFDEIQGTISDAAIRAGTEVHLIDEATGAVHKTVVDAEGKFRFSHVKGRSNFRIELPNAALEEGATLRLADASGNTLREVVADKNGGFLFELLTPEDYEMERLSITDSGQLNLDGMFAKSKTPPSGPDHKILATGVLHYGLNDFSLAEEHEAALVRIAELLKEHPELRIRLEGHTDVRGAARYNQMLSDWRVKEAIRFLAAAGVCHSRMEGQGYGAAKVLNHCVEGVECSEEEHGLNRRIEFRISGIAAEPTDKHH